MKTVISRTCGLLALILALTIHPALAADTASDDGGFYDGNVHIAVTPYLWVPTVNGSFAYDLSDIREGLENFPGSHGTLNTSIGPNKYLSNINSALELAGQIRKGRVALMADLLYLNVSGQKSSFTNFPGPEGNLNLTLSGAISTHLVNTLFTGAASGTLYHKDNTSLDVLLGGRMVFLTASTGWQFSGSEGFLNRSGSASKSVTLGDGIVGLTGAYGIGKKLSIPYYVDIGTGDPNFTTQELLGVKYGQLQLSYRYLYYGGGGSFVQNLRFNGPLVGYTFRF